MLSDDQYPSWSQQAGNALRAGARAARALVGGEQLQVGEPVRALRAETCQDCDKLSDSWRCKLCGCYVPFKVRAATESCPLGKW